MKTILMAATALALSTGASAATNLITNGSFELGTDPGSGFVTLNQGSSGLTGWTVGGAGIDYIGGYWQAADGVRSLDLSGSKAKGKGAAATFAGSVSQTFATVVGKTYKVNFFLAGNPDGGPTTKVQVTRASDPTNPAPSQFYTNTFEVVPGVNTRTDMGWKPYSFTFVAGGTQSNLEFISGVNTAYGPALDNVSAFAVPEPAVWGMMIAGFGVVGFQSRRRRSIKTVAA